MAIDRLATLRKAEAFARAGQVQEAIAEYILLMQEEPDDWSAGNALGDLYLKAGQRERAADVFVQIADSQRDQGFVPKAVALYKKALKARGAEERALLGLAGIAEQQQTYADARRYLDQLQTLRQARGDADGAAECAARLAGIPARRPPGTPPVTSRLPLVPPPLQAPFSDQPPAVPTDAVVPGVSNDAEARLESPPAGDEERLDSGGDGWSLALDVEEEPAPGPEPVAPSADVEADAEAAAPAAATALPPDEDAGSVDLGALLDAPAPSVVAGEGRLETPLEEDLPEIALDIDVPVETWGLVEAASAADPAPPARMAPEVSEPRDEVPAARIGNDTPVGAADLPTGTSVGPDEDAGMAPVPVAGEPAAVDPDTLAVELEAATRVPALRFQASAQLGRLLIARGDLVGGVAWLERVAAEPAPVPEQGLAVLYDLAVALERMGQRERALAILTEIDAESGAYRDVPARIARLAAAAGGPGA